MGNISRERLQCLGAKTESLSLASANSSLVDPQELQGLLPSSAQFGGSTFSEFAPRKQKFFSGSFAIAPWENLIT